MKANMERVKKQDSDSVDRYRAGQAKTAANSQGGEFSDQLNNSPAMAVQRQKLNRMYGDAIQRFEEEPPLQGKLDADLPAQIQVGATEKPNDTGLPDNLKSGIESLSGMSVDDVNVHYNSPEPAKLNAHAFAQGTDIHVAPGQEQHLPHEVWHVVQQAEGRVQPTMQMKQGVPINDDVSLEREADLMGAKALQEGGGPVAGRSVLRSARVEPTVRTMQAKEIGSKDMDALDNSFFNKFRKTAFNRIIEHVKKFEALRFVDENRLILTDEDYKKAEPILADIDKEITSWLNSDSRKGNEAKDQKKKTALEQLKIDVLIYRQNIKSKTQADEDDTDRKAEEEERNRKREENDRKKAEEKARIEAERKARIEAEQKARIEAEQKAIIQAPSDAKKQVELTNKNKLQERKEKVWAVGDDYDEEDEYESDMLKFEAVYNKEVEDKLKREMESIKQKYRETWKSKWKASTGYKKFQAKENGFETEAQWVERKLDKDKDLKKELDAHAEKSKAESKSRQAIEREFEAAWHASDSKKAGQSQGDYLKRKTAAELERMNYPDLSLRDAVQRSNKFLSTIPGKIDMINNHGNSIEEIRESFKVYYSLTLEVEDEAWSKRIGLGTYFVRGASKEESKNTEDKFKKTATDEDLANVAKLMADSPKIHTHLKSIKNEIVGDNEQVKSLNTEIAHKLSHQFLPTPFRRGFDTAVDRVAFKAWAQLLQDKYVEESDLHAGKANFAATVSEAVAGNTSMMGLGEDSSRQTAEKTSDEFKNTEAVARFEHTANASTLFDGVSNALASLQGILKFVKSNEERKEGVRQKSYAEVGKDAVELAGKLTGMIAWVGKLGIPIVGTVVSIIVSILDGVKFLSRYLDEKILDEQEESRAAHEQSGLLGATKRITARSKTLSIYSAVDLIASGCKLFSEIFAASGPVSAALGAIALAISLGKTVYDVIESSYAAGVQQEAKLALETGEQGASGRVLSESDDVAVTAIIVEAKDALGRGENDHIAVRKLKAFNITQESISKNSVRDLRTVILKELNREEKAKTLGQKIKFWDSSNEKTL